MSQSIKQLYGKELGATDGEIGHVKDFYFDDQDWAIRYLVADTGTWLPGRKVLISPHCLGGLDEGMKVVSIRLNKKQIENSPSFESHLPVSRQFEEEYHRYYGWPFYWQGDFLWGPSDYPISQPPAETVSSKRAAGSAPGKRSDAHLRSAKAVNGYHLQATDGIAGHVCDFMIDAKNWSIGQVVVKIGHRFSGKEFQIPVTHVTRISYEDSTLIVDLSKDAIERNTAHHAASITAAV